MKAETFLPFHLPVFPSAIRIVRSVGRAYPDDYLLYPYTGIDVLQSSSVTAENDFYYTVAPEFPTLAKIYPGGIADGFLTFRIDQGDPSPILSYDFNPYSSEDPVLWFALY